MAVSSPHQSQGARDQGNLQSGGGMWEFAVPLDDENTDFKKQKPFMSDDYSTQSNFSRPALATQANGASRSYQPRSNTVDSQRSDGSNHVDDNSNLAPTRVNQLQRKHSDVSGAGSDPDSVLEYYNGQANSKGVSRDTSQTGRPGDKKKKPTLAPAWNPDDDTDAWIHRDKLAQIESRELQEAQRNGFGVSRTSRSNSRSATRSASASRTRSRKNSEQQEGTMSGDEQVGHHDKRQRLVSPIPAEDEEGDTEQMQWDIRTPEEIAADRENYAPRQHTIRPSTSRIPIAKTSPLPVATTFTERDSPLARPRKGSGAWNGESFAVNGARVRSGSVGSQVLLDEPNALEAVRTPVRAESSVPNSPNSSPPKAKTPGKPNPTSGARKASARLNAQPKSRNTSANSPVKRPGTSSGAISRPTTSHNRPEGEAPWIATMYKPDPRLPPDQQIIPTHAKRMQQEQWETEGKVGSAYDRDFRLLNTEQFSRPQSMVKDAEKMDRIEHQDEQWPLPSPTKQNFENSRPGTSGGEPGGYKLTPTIPQSPHIASKRNSLQPPEPATKPKSPVRMQEPPETEEKKSCACCIVM